jgi:hypothetical protein
MTPVFRESKNCSPSYLEPKPVFRETKLLNVFYPTCAQCAFDNDRAVPRGLPERHRPGKELVMNECHPLTRSMREFWHKMPSGDRRLSRTHDLVGASGMLTCESSGFSSHGMEPMHAMGSGEISAALVSDTVSWRMVRLPSIFDALMGTSCSLAESRHRRAGNPKTLNSKP